MHTLGHNIAIVFPGQGSQFVGMARDLYEASTAARAIFGTADRESGLEITRLCFEGPEEELKDTANAQPAVVTASIAAFAATLEIAAQQGIDLQPGITAGHSVGQFSALGAAQAIAFGALIKLVAARGRLMKEAGDRNPGGMAAVLGVAPTVVEDACDEASAHGIVCPANYNSPEQTVISGNQHGLSAAKELLLQRGAKKVIPLAVSVANHSPLMAQAASQFRVLLDTLNVQPASFPIVANGSARAIVEPEEILAELRQHMLGPVRWTDSVAQMASSGAGIFLEIGPGQVLAGLIKRCGQKGTVMSLGTHEGILAFCAMLAENVIGAV